MLEYFTHFLTNLAVTAVALWISSHFFVGVKFSNSLSLVAAALLLGLVNSTLKPILILLTLPLTLLTLGFFLLILNALMLHLVAALVPGFRLQGFWSALLTSSFVSLVTFIAEWMMAAEEIPVLPQSTGGVWL
jgi:putative membrane protein